tara:strand:- start:287 stop:601 length:315 start_codon:yes stop_codon:yes gene_type:complete
MAPVNDWGIKISEEGFDVKTAADEDLVMSSSFDMLKTSATGSATGATTVAHGLAYIPIFFTSLQSAGKGSIIGDDRITSCNATNLVVAAGGTVKYYIFYQEGIT